MGLFFRKKNYTPLPRRLSGSRVHLIPLYIIVYFFIFAAGITGGYVALADTFGLPRQVPADFWQEIGRFLPTPTPTHTFSPLATPAKEWKEYQNTGQDFALSHPADWNVKEMNGFLNEVHISPPDQSVVLIFSGGKSSLDIDSSPVQVEPYTLTVSENQYTAEKKQTSSGIVHIATLLHHPSKMLYITIHSPAADVKPDAHYIELFHSHESEIKKILNSFRFTDEQADWQLFENKTFEYDFFYPRNWYILREQNPSQEWGMDSVIGMSPIASGSPLLRFEFLKEPAQDEQQTELNSVQINGMAAAVFDGQPEDVENLFLKKYIVTLKEGSYVKATILPLIFPPNQMIPPGRVEIWLREADQIINSLRVIESSQ